jgi:hypothetical protein
MENLAVERYRGAVAAFEAPFRLWAPNLKIITDFTRQKIVHFTMPRNC